MKKILLGTLSLFMSTMLFASDWHVCMGSFRNLDKAKERVSVLNNNGFSVFITEYKKSENDKLYRVLFSEKFVNKKDATFRRNELLKLSKIKKLGFTDLWCCESDGNKVEERATTFVPITREVAKEPEKQTVIVKVNNIEEQRFDITSDDRLIKVNINIDDLISSPEQASESDVETSSTEENPVESTNEPVSDTISNEVSDSAEVNSEVDAK